MNRQIVTVLILVALPFFYVANLPGASIQSLGGGTSSGGSVGPSGPPGPTLGVQQDGGVTTNVSTINFTIGLLSTIVGTRADISPNYGTGIVSVAGSNSGGVSNKFAREDHQHTITAGLITNAMINASAGIVYSKLALTNSIVNADIAAAAAIAYAKLALTGSIVNADLSGAAAIAYSKLALSNSIVNADVAVGAAIVYAKLVLTNSIVNADIASGAAIAYSKLALTTSIVNGDISAVAAIVYSKLALTNSIQIGDITAGSKTGTGTKLVTDNGPTVAAPIFTGIVTADTITSSTKLSLNGGGTNQNVELTATGTGGIVAFNRLSLFGTASTPSGAVAGDIYNRTDFNAPAYNSALISGDALLCLGISTTTSNTTITGQTSFTDSGGPTIPCAANTLKVGMAFTVQQEVIYTSNLTDTWQLRFVYGSTVIATGTATSGNLATLQQCIFQVKTVGASGRIAGFFSIGGAAQVLDNIPFDTTGTNTFKFQVVQSTSNVGNTFATIGGFSRRDR